MSEAAIYHVLVVIIFMYKSTTSGIKVSSYLNNKFINIDWHLNICIVIYSVFEQEAYHPSCPHLRIESREICLLVHLFVTLFLNSCLHPGSLLSNGLLQEGTFSHSQCVCHNHRSCRMADPLVWGGLRCPGLESVEIFPLRFSGHLFEVEARTSSRHLVNTLPFSIVKHIGGENRITFSFLPVRSTNTWKYSVQHICQMYIWYRLYHLFSL